MKLAVCLLTADRPAYTAETVLGYLNHAESPAHILLHADDGSVKRDNLEIATAAGFETVYTTQARVGQLSAVRYMWNAALNRGATHILHLENDQRFVAALPRWLPLALVRFDCVRLYGDKRMEHGPRQRTGQHIMGTKEPIDWQFQFQDASGSWLGASAHWGGQASITNAALLCAAANEAARFKDLSLGRLQRIQTLRPERTIVWHIGHTQTDDFKTC
jgi:hypothetical protein